MGLSTVSTYTWYRATSVDGSCLHLLMISWSLTGISWDIPLLGKYPLLNPGLFHVISVLVTANGEYTNYSLWIQVPSWEVFGV